MRTLCCGLVFLLAGGCASTGGPKRLAPKVVLGALMLGSAALAIGAAVKSNAIERDLANDYGDRELGGREFADRDAEGERWNRIARASTFVSALSLLGLGVVWEMSLGDTKAQPAEKPAPQPLIFPVPSAQLRLDLPARRPQMSAAAR